MRAVVKQTQLSVTAVIDRCKMDVADLARLEVGGLFPLSDVTLDDVDLEMKVSGEVRSVGRGRLGAYKRNKAIRIIKPPERGFLEPLAEALGVEVSHE